MSAPETSVSALLIRWREGDADALNALTPLVYAQLRQMARRHLAGERPDFSLCATELVHEAYRKLVGASVPWEDRAHFLAIASRQMRQVLVDHARTRRRQKRGGGEWERVTLTESVKPADGPAIDILMVQDALDRLESLDPRKAQIVDLLVFGGVTAEEAAACLGVSEPTVRRDWKMARAWLHNELKPAARGMAH
jgi:RNA polymerase sigma factor (TIGR02999 family)